MDKPVFDPVEFAGNPSVAKLKFAKVTKDQLKYLATSFGIPLTQIAKIQLKHSSSLIWEKHRK